MLWVWKIAQRSLTLLYNALKHDSILHDAPLLKPAVLAINMSHNTVFMKPGKDELLVGHTRQPDRKLVSPCTEIRRDPAKLSLASDILEACSILPDCQLTPGDEFVMNSLSTATATASLVLVLETFSL